jgi:hypothetical protein
MATFRKVHTTFWTDPFVENLSQEQKLFYLYLITNTKTTQSGIYEISKKYISYETGYSIKEVNELLNYFIQHKKIMYSESTNEICITNWINYNLSTSHSVLNCIWKDVQLVKDKNLIKSIYTTDLIKTLESVPMGSNGKGGPYTPLIEYLHHIYTLNTECTQSMYTPKQEEEEKEEEEVKEEVEVEVQAEEEVMLEEYYNEEYERILNEDYENGKLNPQVEVFFELEKELKNN